MKLHVTQVGQCRRKWHHILRGDSKMPPHRVAVNGILSHSIIEKCIKGGDVEDVEVDYPNLITDKRDNINTISEGMYNESLEASLGHVGKFHKWVEETKHNISDFTSEETLEIPYGDHILTGTPDLYNERLIIDFKTGKPVVRKNYVKQLAAYSYMLNEHGSPMNDINEGLLVFFGGNEPAERVISTKKLESGLDDFLNELESDIAFIDSWLEAGEDEKPRGECSFGFPCAFCSWRHLCNGY